MRTRSLPGAAPWEEAEKFNSPCAQCDDLGAKHVKVAGGIDRRQLPLMGTCEHPLDHSETKGKYLEKAVVSVSLLGGVSLATAFFFVLRSCSTFQTDVVVRAEY